MLERVLGFRYCSAFCMTPKPEKTEAPNTRICDNIVMLLLRRAVLVAGLTISASLRLVAALTKRA